MANGYIGLVNIGEDYYKIGSTAYAVLDTNTNGSGTITTSTTQVDFVVPLNGYVNTEGATIHIKFIQKNDVDDKPLTLKVGGDNPHPIINPNGTTTWAANSIISFTFDGTNWVMNSSQISVDASQLDISGFGNISKEGTLTNTDVTIGQGDKLIIAGANDNKIARASLAFTGAITTQDQSTAFLRSDGTWAAPTYTQDTHYQAKLIVGGSTTATANAPRTITQNEIYLNIIEDSTVRSHHKIVGAGGTTVSTDNDGNITITGKTGTVTSITPGDGLVNGATTSTNTTAITESGTISIKAGGVTNNMLAGSITPEKLDNTATITIGEQSIKVGGSFNTATLLQDLSLSSAMHYKGEVAAIPPASGIYVAGDVVTLEDTAEEYVYDGTNWRELGSESSYKLVQSAVSDPAVPDSGVTTSNSFIATISQNAQGVITVTKRNVPVTSVAGLTGEITAVSLQSALSLGNYIPKSIGTAAGDIIYWNENSDPRRLAKGADGQVLKMVSGLPAWAADTSSDPTVTQNIVATTDTNDYPLLLSYYNKTTNTTTKQTVNRVSTIYANKDGELYATSFHGDGANITNITTDHIGGTGNGTKYLRQDGWKTVSISVSADNTNGTVVTGVGFDQGTFPTLATDSGKAATFVVNNGILIITAGSDAALTNGTLPSLGTISKATLGITGT